MIEEVKDFFGDVKDKVGNGGFIVLILAVVVFFLYNLFKDDSDTGEVYYTPTGVTGYPSLEQNADVVIDTVTQNMEGYYNEMLNVMQENNNNITGNINESTSTLLGALTDSESNIIGNIGDSTNSILGNISDSTDRIMDSNNAIKGSIADSTENILGNIGESTDRITETVDGAKDELTHNMGLGFDSVHLGFETVENYINESMSKVEDLSSKIDNIDTTPRVEYVTKTEYVEVPKTEYITQYVPSVGTGAAIGGTTGATTASKVTSAASKVANATSTAKATSADDTYTYKTKSGLNTSSSIVDALKATGEDSSLANRKKIAEANGISNYTGTYSQNASLLKKLKAGELKKAI